jgi:hypothetical protein
LPIPEIDWQHKEQQQKTQEETCYGKREQDKNEMETEERMIMKVDGKLICLKN